MTAGRLRDAAELLGAAVEAAIDGLDLTEADAGAVQLARHYAALIDEQEEPKLRAWALRWIGPELLKCLESLGAKPLARSRLKGGKPEDAAEDPIDALRRARPQRRA